MNITTNDLKKKKIKEIFSNKKNLNKINHKIKKYFKNQNNELLNLWKKINRKILKKNEENLICKNYEFLLKLNNISINKDLEIIKIFVYIKLVFFQLSISINNIKFKFLKELETLINFFENKIFFLKINIAKDSNENIKKYLILNSKLSQKIKNIGSLFYAINNNEQYYKYGINIFIMGLIYKIVINREKKDINYNIFKKKLALSSDIINNIIKIDNFYFNFFIINNNKILNKMVKINNRNK